MPTSAMDLIPQPQNVTLGVDMLRLPRTMSVTPPGDAADEDRFAADDLASLLRLERGIDIRASAPFPIELARSAGPSEGYRLTVAPDRVHIEGSDAAGGESDSLVSKRAITAARQLEEIEDPQLRDQLLAMIRTCARSAS